MGRGLKKILSSGSRYILKSAKSQNLEWLKVTPRQVVRNQVSVQGRKNENTPKFPSRDKWY